VCAFCWFTLQQLYHNAQNRGVRGGTNKQTTLTFNSEISLHNFDIPQRRPTS